MVVRLGNTETANYGTCLIGPLGRFSMEFHGFTSGRKPRGPGSFAAAGSWGL